MTLPALGLVSIGASSAAWADWLGKHGASVWSGNTAGMGKGYKLVQVTSAPCHSSLYRQALHSTGTSLRLTSCFWEVAGDSKLSLLASHAASAALLLSNLSEADAGLGMLQLESQEQGPW